MKTALIFLKKPAIAFFALRFVLLTGIIVFAVSMGKSQTNAIAITTDQQKMKS